MIQGPVEQPDTERFYVIRQLGAGAMGVVYEAQDLERDARVALKTLQRLDPSMLYLFKQEFRSLTDIVHPNLVTLYELFSTKNQWFFSMEMVAGTSFISYLRDEHSTESSQNMEDVSATGDEGEVVGVPSSANQFASFSPGAGAGDWNDGQLTEALDLSFLDKDESPEETTAFAPSCCDIGMLRSTLGQLAAGVHYLHQAGKLHCDIKPTNVLVTAEGKVVILDFGLVQSFGEQVWLKQGERGVFGTPNYMAPEQVAADKLSPACDWYAVGVMLYRALTGKLPFSGRSKDVMIAKQGAEPPPPDRWVPGVPEDLNDLCVSLLRRRPEDRPPGNEVLARLSISAEAIASGALIPGVGKSPFIGRERYLEALNDAYAATIAGSTVAVYCHGVSGMGKSMLIERFLDDLSAGHEAVILSGRCYEQESVPFKTMDSVIDALTHHLRTLRPESLAEMIPADIDPLLQMFPVLLRVKTLAGLPRDGVQIPDARELRLRAFAGLRDLIGRLAQRQPLVIFIDDVQWGDVDSVPLIAELLRPPGSPKLMLLLSYRSEEVERSSCLRSLINLAETEFADLRPRFISVEPLTPEEAMELALAELPATDHNHESRARTIVEESGGSPFFVHELTRHVRSGAVLERGSLRLSDVIQARVERLNEEARRALEVVSLAGQPLATRDATAAAALTGTTLAVMAELRASHLVKVGGTANAEMVEAYHDRIRETVVGRLDKDLRRDHHRELATVLEQAEDIDPERLATHFLGADMTEKAGGYFYAAAEQANAALAFDRAAHLYEQSLQHSILTTDRQQELRNKFGTALANAGHSASAAEQFLQAARNCDYHDRLELQRLASEQYLMSGHLDEGLAHMRSVLEEVGLAYPRTTAHAIVVILLGRLQLRLRGFGFRERSTDRLSDDLATKLHTCWAAAKGLSMFDAVRGAAFFIRYALLALQSGDRYHIASGVSYLSIVVVYPGGREKMLQIAEDVARPLEDPFPRTLIRMHRGIHAYLCTRFQQACDDCAEAEAEFREKCTGVQFELNSSQRFVVWSLIYMGRLSEARGRLTALIQEAQQRGDLYAYTNMTSGLTVLVSLASDQPSAARKELNETMQRWTRKGFHLQHSTALLGNVFIDLYEGDIAAAHERMCENWRPLRRSGLMRLPILKSCMLHLKAATALAYAWTAPDKEALLSDAEDRLKELDRVALPTAAPLVCTLRASLAAHRDDRPAAADWLAKAVALFDGLDMAHYASAFRRCQGLMSDGPARKELIAASMEWMSAEQVRKPERMTVALAPGFRDYSI